MDSGRCFRLMAELIAVFVAPLHIHHNVMCRMYTEIYLAHIILLSLSWVSPLTRQPSLFAQPSNPHYVQVTNQSLHPKFSSHLRALKNPQIKKLGPGAQNKTLVVILFLSPGLTMTKWRKNLTFDIFPNAIWNQWKVKCSYIG